MALSKNALGAAAAIGILAAVTLSVRCWELLGPGQGNARPSGAAPLFCAGVQTASSAIGIACAQHRSRFLAEAVRAGFAPASCEAAVLPAGATAGSLVVVEARGRSCAVVGVRRLPAAAAMLCGARLDLNAVSAAELELLPGIGSVRARRIVESRLKDGPFPDVDALDRVHGVGPKTVERLRPWIAVDEENEKNEEENEEENEEGCAPGCGEVRSAHPL